MNFRSGQVPQACEALRELADSERQVTPLQATTLQATPLQATTLQATTLREGPRGIPPARPDAVVSAIASTAVPARPPIGAAEVNPPWVADVAVEAFGASFFYL